MSRVLGNNPFEPGDGDGQEAPQKEEAGEKAAGKKGPAKAAAAKKEPVKAAAKKEPAKAAATKKGPAKAAAKAAAAKKAEPKAAATKKAEPKKVETAPPKTEVAEAKGAATKAAEKGPPAPVEGASIAAAPMRPADLATPPAPPEHATQAAQQAGGPEKQAGGPEKQVSGPEKQVSGPEKQAGGPEKQAGGRDPGLEGRSGQALFPGSAAVERSDQPGRGRERGHDYDHDYDHVDVDVDATVAATATVGATVGATATATGPAGADHEAAAQGPAIEEDQPPAPAEMVLVPPAPTAVPLPRRAPALTRIGRRYRELALRGRATSVDDFGLDEKALERYEPALEWLYSRYFRVETEGLENVPDHGRALLVGNRAGTLPWDSLILSHAVRREHPLGRPLRPLLEDYAFHAPYLGVLLGRLGAVRACQENAERLLQAEQLVGVFPEGQKGSGKRFADRYRLQRFGRGGFIKLALRTRTPILPVAIVGAEETQPLLGKLGWLGRPLGLPHLPITPTFPWLGPLGLLPLPSKWHLRIGAPLHLYSEYDPEAAEDLGLVGRLAEQVRQRIQEMLDGLLGQRRSVWSFREGR